MSDKEDVDRLVAEINEEAENLAKARVRAAQRFRVFRVAGPPSAPVSIWGRKNTRWFIYGLQLSAAMHSVADRQWGWALYYVACYASLVAVTAYVAREVRR